ncbi:uncharacterized protein LOC34624260 [Cyclospora cayetanensis]|uniref:Uncharacterized protein LOC34624260 n=1 Tax=Cyclospora cayetanensis TaxID=88456 RepID=A0A6P6RVA9_9EIME|nr:uncharacterized protein LOC34624260 [Cyclospora cayetanensis]
MLSLTRWHSRLQAAARVLSGGPVYVSDSPHDLRTHAQTLIDRLGGGPLLNASRSPCGRPPWRLLRCISVGLPMEDCLFFDPRKTPTGFKLWNVCMGGFVIGVFGLYEAPGGIAYTTQLHQQQLLLLQQTRGPWVRQDSRGTGALPTDLLCCDLEDWNAAPLHPLHPWEVTTHFATCHMFAVAPIYRLGGPPGGAPRSARVALLGLRGPYAGLAAFLFPPAAVELTSATEEQEEGVFAQVIAAGDLVFWHEGPQDPCCLFVRSEECHSEKKLSKRGFEAAEPPEIPIVSLWGLDALASVEASLEELCQNSRLRSTSLTARKAVLSPLGGRSRGSERRSPSTYHPSTSAGETAAATAAKAAAARQASSTLNSSTPASRQRAADQRLPREQRRKLQRQILQEQGTLARGAGLRAVWCMYRALVEKEIAPASTSVILPVKEEDISHLLQLLQHLLRNTPEPLLQEVLLSPYRPDQKQQRQETPETGAPTGLLGEFLLPLLQQIPKLRMLQKTQQTYAAAVHAAVQKAESDTVVVLPPEARVAPHWLKFLLLQLQQQPFAVVFPAEVEEPSADGPQCNAGAKRGLPSCHALEGSAAASGSVLSSLVLPGAVFATARDLLLAADTPEPLLHHREGVLLEVSFLAAACGLPLEEAQQHALLRSRLRVAEAWLGDFAVLPWLALGEPNIPLGRPPRPLWLRLQGMEKAMAATATPASAKGGPTPADTVAAAVADTAVPLQTRPSTDTAAHALVERCSKRSAAAIAAAAAANTGLLQGPPQGLLEDRIPLLGNIKWLWMHRWPPLCLFLAEEGPLGQRLEVTANCSGEGSLFAAVRKVQQEQQQEQQANYLQIRALSSAQADTCLDGRLIAVPCNPQDPQQCTKPAVAAWPYTPESTICASSRAIPKTVTRSVFSQKALRTACSEGGGYKRYSQRAVGIRGSP